MGILKTSTLSVYLFVVISILRKSVCSKRLNSMFWKLNSIPCSSPLGGECTVHEIAVSLEIPGPVPRFQLHKLEGCADRVDLARMGSLSSVLNTQNRIHLHDFIRILLLAFFFRELALRKNIYGLCL